MEIINLIILAITSLQVLGSVVDGIKKPNEPQKQEQKGEEAERGHDMR